MKMLTRVVFKNKAEYVTHWDEPESTASAVFSQAIREAEAAEGQPHAGAWQEFPG